MQVKKKTYIMIAVLVVIIFVFIGGYLLEKKADEHACAINFVATFDFNVVIGTPESQVARTLLTQLLDQYKSMPRCYTLGITDYSITSVGTPTAVQKDFTVPATFDVIPLSKSQTLWGVASTTWDGDWIRGESVTLGIQDVSTTTATKSYRLVLQ
jgi:hypothetical protein